MEDTFNRLKKDGQNSVENLINWLKDSKIIDGVKVTEANARKLFDDVKDKQNVEMEKFKQAINTLATEHKSNVETFSKALATEVEGRGAKFLAAAAAATTAAASAAQDAAANAFKQAMAKK